MKAVILAAGYATRLYPLTLDKPKCLLPVGGQTILDFLCREISRISQIDQIVIVTNAKFYAQLKTWSDSASVKVPVEVVNDGTTSNETRLGAIGDLAFTLDHCSIHSDVLMLASDNLFEGGLEDFVRFAAAKPDAASIGVYDIGDPQLASGKYGVIELKSSGEVLRIEEKPLKPKTSLIGMGLYFFPKGTLPRVREYLATSQAKDAPGHYIRWLSEKIKIFGLVFSGLWYDIGDLTALKAADKIFGEKNHER